MSSPTSLVASPAEAKDEAKVEANPTSTPPNSSTIPARANSKCSIAKSNSTASAGQRSVASHISVRVIGTIPYGGLRLQNPPGSPQSLSSLEEPASNTSRRVVPPPPECLKNGDVFLIMGLPQGFTAGIDTLAVTATSTRILGFRDIPPGPHLLWVSEPGAMSRCGYWFVTEKQGIARVKQWDRYNEVLGETGSQFEARNQKENADKVYPGLVSYSYRGSHGSSATDPSQPSLESPSRPGRTSGSGPAKGGDGNDDDATTWQRLTSAITPALLDRVTGKWDVGEWLVDTSDTPKGEIRFPERGRLLSSISGSELDFLFPQDDVDIDLLSISSTKSKKKAKDTDLPPDITPRLLEVLANGGNVSRHSKHSRPVIDDDLVGELQFAFLTGMHVGNYSCIEQWWHVLLKVILRSYRLAISRPYFCRDLLRTLHAQLVYSDKYLAPAGDDGQGAGQSNDRRRRRRNTGSPILDTIPRNRPRLRSALNVYRQCLKVVLYERKCPITQGDRDMIERTFSDIEVWCWEYGWDLRCPTYLAPEIKNNNAKRGKIAAYGAKDVTYDDDDDDYEPVIVELDERGLERGLVSWD